MKLVDLNCPGCGAAIKVNQELSRGICNFCGREFLIDDEVQKMEIVNGRQLGFQQEQGRLEAVEKNREALLTDLQEALQVQKDHDDLSSMVPKKKRAYEQKMKSNGTEIAIVISALVADVILGAILSECLPIDGIALLQLYVCVILIIPIGLLAVAFIKNERKMKEQTCTRLEREIEELELKWKETEEKYEEKIAIIPKDYRNISAIDSFYKFVSNRRADDLKQAVNLYEEELHRQRVEETQAAILREAQKQTEVQRREAQKHH